MVATTDSGLARILRRTGATLSYDPGQRYVIVTAADRRTITFTLGRALVRAGDEQIVAQVAPFVAGTRTYLPLFTLAQALYLEPVPVNGETVLQPQIGELIVRTQGETTLVTLHGAIPLTFKRLSGSSNAGVALALDGVSSQLNRTRTIATGSLREVDLYIGGDLRHPTTTVNFDPRGNQTAHALLSDGSPNEVTLEFGARGTALRGEPLPAESGTHPAGRAVAVQPSVTTLPSISPMQPVAPAQTVAPAQPAAQLQLPPIVAPPPPLVPSTSGSSAEAPPMRIRETPIPYQAPLPQCTVVPINLNGPRPDATGTGDGNQGDADQMPSPAEPTSDGSGITAVKGVSIVPSGSAVHIDIALGGPVTYHWHRLLDNRWYIDLDNARLLVPPERSRSPISPASPRCAFINSVTDPHPVVRVTLALDEPKGGRAARDADRTHALRRAFRRCRWPSVRWWRRTIRRHRRRGIRRADPAHDRGNDSDERTTQWRRAAGQLRAQRPAASQVGRDRSGTRRKRSRRAAQRSQREGPDDRYLAPSPDALGRARLERGDDAGAATSTSGPREALAATRADGRPNPDDRAELQARDDIANAGGARFFLSIHINSSTLSSIRGTTVYYYKGLDRPFADALHRRLADALGIPDLGVRKDKLYVLNHSTMPAALVEVAFISSPVDAQLLRSPEFRQRVAVAIADGIGDFASSQSPAPAQ